MHVKIAVTCMILLVIKEDKAKASREEFGKVKKI